MQKLKVVAIVVGLAATIAIPAHGDASGSNGRIAFLASADGHLQLFTIKPDGSGLLQVTRGLSAVSEYGTAWSPDGSSLLIVRSGARGDAIYRTGLDGARFVGVGPACTGTCLGD